MPATVNAGVVVADATVINPPVKPTDVTVPPLPVDDNVPPEKFNPEPIVTAEIAVPLPCSSPVILVEIVIAGVLEALATDPAKPFALATETVVTDPPPDALIALATKDVVAICVVLVPVVAVGAVGVPVNAGLTAKTTLPVPVLELVLNEPLVRDKNPLVLVPTKFCNIEDKLIVGFPAVPSALAIETPTPLLAIETLVNVVEFVLTWMPLPELTNDDKAPVTAIV